MFCPTPFDQMTAFGSGCLASTVIPTFILAAPQPHCFQASCGSAGFVLNRKRLPRDQTLSDARNEKTRAYGPRTSPKTKVSGPFGPDTSLSQLSHPDAAPKVGVRTERPEDVSALPAERKAGSTRGP